MSSQAAELAHRLARDAEAVCRHYLSNGRREGRYWLVGDVRQHARPQPVRPAERTGLRQGRRRQMDRCGDRRPWRSPRPHRREAAALTTSATSLDEARRFLSLPRPEPEPDHGRRRSPHRRDRRKSARRLFAMSQPISGTLVEAYLRKRGITALHGTGSLRFHPRCYYRPDGESPTETWPALIAAVTDLAGTDHRRASHLARPVRRRQGADRHAAAGDGPSARQRRPLRCGA